MFLGSYSLLIVENECIPPPQGGPEIKHPFQGGVPGKGSVLAKPSGPPGASLAWRTQFWAHLTRGHASLCGKCGTCVLGQEFCREQGTAYCLRCVPKSLGTQIHSTLPSFLAKSIVPQGMTLPRASELPPRASFEAACLGFITFATNTADIFNKMYLSITLSVQKKSFFM